MYWSYAANWSNPIIERLEWRTDVIAAYNATEQRIQLRPKPRRWLEFSALTRDAVTRQKLEADIWSNSTQPWQLPDYPFAAVVTEPIANNSTALVVDRVAGLTLGAAVLIAHDQHQLINIIAIDDDIITVDPPIVGAWRIDTAVMPLQSAHLDQQRLTRWSDAVVYDTFRFLTLDYALPAIDIDDQYRGAALFNFKHNWTQAPTIDYQRKMQVIDFGNSIFREDESGRPTLLKRCFISLSSAAEIDQFRGFLQHICGRLRSFWMCSDSTLDVVATDETQLKVRGAVAQYNQQRRDIKIVYVDGGHTYRRIAAVANLGAGLERITLDHAVTQDVAYIEWLDLCRLEADAIEIAYISCDYAEVRLDIRTLRNTDHATYPAAPDYSSDGCVCGIEYGWFTSTLYPIESQERLAASVPVFAGGILMPMYVDQINPLAASVPTFAGGTLAPLPPPTVLTPDLNLLAASVPTFAGGLLKQEPLLTPDLNLLSASVPTFAGGSLV